MLVEGGGREERGREERGREGEGRGVYASGERREGRCMGGGVCRT